MEPNLTLKDLKMHFFNVTANPQSTILKCCMAICVLFIFSALSAHAQAPTISYSSPQSYFPGTVITPLTPVGSGVAAMGYSNTPSVIGSGFSSVYGVTSDLIGNVYITDPVAGQIKKVPTGSGSPVVLLSGIVAQLKDISVDTLGNIFFTNFSHNVNKLAAGASKATTIVGFIQTPWGVAADNNGKVFVADNGRGQVDQIISGLGGGSGSAGNLPTGVAVDAADRLYIANEGTNTSINGPVGNIGSGFNQANGVAVDFSDNVYVADQGNNAVKMVAAGSNTPVAIGSGFSSPTGVAVDGVGNVYVADNGNNLLKKISPVGGYFISPTLLPPGLTFNNNTGVISGTPTGSFAKKKYTITAYNSFGSASASVIIAVQNSVDLTNIGIEGDPGITSSPAFSPSVTKYTVGIDSTIHQIGVFAATLDATATFTINGTVSSQNFVTGVNLHKGLNIAPIVVKSKDGLAAKLTIYTLQEECCPQMPTLPHLTWAAAAIYRLTLHLL